MVPRWPIVLASASPRRKELLAKVLSEFEVLPADFAEEDFPITDPRLQAEFLALEKAKVVAQSRPESLVIGSDTVVAVDIGNDSPSQLAKPCDERDATRMLWLLSGKTHLVITGVALVSPGGTIVASDTTSVTFRALIAEEIEEYVATGEPMDKAGAYAIQGGAAAFVRAVEGSITNVIGLPMELLSRLLLENGLADLDPSHGG